MQDFISISGFTILDPKGLRKRDVINRLSVSILFAIDKDTL